LTYTTQRLIRILCDPAAWRWQERVRAARALGKTQYDAEETEAVA
jgi:hypothetical protein